MEPVSQITPDFGPAAYVVLFGYCALKSGVLPMLVGYAAYRGALDPALVALATFSGGYLGDEARFAGARHYGDSIVARFPRLTRPAERAKALAARYGALYIFAYRYPKGLRTIGALPIGWSSMPWGEFTLLNAASAAVWTGLLVGGGYLFGETIERSAVSHWGTASVALLFGFLIAMTIAARRLSRATLADEPAQS